ncbi:MAG: MoaD/ThiS family protein [Acidiferrobacterales bacterium]
MHVRVTFTDNIQRHVACPPMEVGGNTVREVLEQVFKKSPRMRSYVLDDQGGVRRHMVIFVNGLQICDTKTLGDPVPAGSEVYVMQALSGG